MQLAAEDIRLFFLLRRSLLYFANQQLGVLPDQVDTGNDLAGVSFEDLQKVRNAMMGRPDLLNSFVTLNPWGLPNDQLDIVRSWRHSIKGKFYVYRQLKSYTVFLSAEGPAIAYGVLDLLNPLSSLIKEPLPVFAETVLLPFRDKIINDGMLTFFSVSFGPGIRRSLNERYTEAKASRGIVTTLPMPPAPAPAEGPKARAGPVKRPLSKQETVETVEIIGKMTDAVCRNLLNEEYAELCRALAQKLARKRPSPLLSGNASTWAGAIVRTIGWVNFVDDPSQEPRLALKDIDHVFGIGASTGQTKSAQIRKTLKIGRLEPEWTLKSKIAQNPRAWLIELNGLIVDARKIHPAIQKEAFRKGLIPYVPEPPVSAEHVSKPAEVPPAPPPKEDDPNQMKLGF